MVSYAPFSIAASTLVLSGFIGMSTALAQEPTLTGTTWALQQIQYNDDTLLEANPPENYTIEFMEDGTVAIQADCNRVRGTFVEPGEGPFITLGPSTLAACPPESIDGEFVQGLGVATNYFFQDGFLYMDMLADTGTMQFAPAATPAAAEPTAEEETQTTVVEEQTPAEPTTPPPTEPTQPQPVRGLW